MSAVIRVTDEEIRASGESESRIISRMADYLGPEWYLSTIKRNQAESALDINWVRARGVEDTL